MKAYLLQDCENYKLYLGFGEDASEAATRLCVSIGIDPAAALKFSVGGSYEFGPNNPIDVTKWWPYFSCDSWEERRSPINIVQGRGR